MSLQIGPMSALGLPPGTATAFFAAHWKRRIALALPRFYAWQCIHPPDNHGADSCWGVYDPARQELLGLMGLNRRAYFLNGQTLKGAEMTTYIASPRGTRLGAGARLVQDLQTHFEVLMGMSLSAQGTTAFLRAGFRVFQAVPRFLRVYDLDPLRPFASIEPLAEKLLRARPPLPMPPHLRLQSPTPSGMETAMHWLRDHAHGFARDPAHLQWRFDRHPAYTHHRHEVCTPDGPAQLHIRPHHAPDFTILHILDAYGPGVAHLLPVIDHLSAIHQAHIADFFCTHSAINAHFLAGGWFSNTDDTCFRFPHLFNPVERREPLSNSYTLWSRHHMPPLCDTGRLYLTKQDMDFDRPAGPMLQTLEVPPS